MKFLSSLLGKSQSQTPAPPSEDDGQQQQDGGPAASPEKTPAKNDSEKQQDAHDRGDNQASDAHSRNKPAKTRAPADEPASSGGNPGGRDKPAKSPAPTEPVTLKGEFARLDLPDPVARAIVACGFTDCTPVQREVLAHALDGHDIIAQAQTGTGKTAAFLLTIITYHLENLEVEPRPPGTPFALIIAPTRELVMQIAQDAYDLARFTDLSIVTLVGGIDYDRQRKQCAGRVDLVVATPGRLLDFCRQRIVDLGQVEHMVLDEADRMLSMGFIPDVKAIIRRTPNKDKRQTQLYSATFSFDIRQLAENWTKEPHRVTIEPDSVAVDTVTQLVYLTSEEQKFDVLYNILKDLSRAIVFVNRRDQTRLLESRLSRLDIRTGLLSGEVQQRKRIKTLEDFKSGAIQVLVATDVAGRGLHVDDVSHVINYNLPEDPEDYVHRIGRTGRAGNSGISISLACEVDSFMLPDIEKLLGVPMVCQQPPEELLVPAPRRSGTDGGKGDQAGGNRERGFDKRRSNSRPRRGGGH